ncbi:integrin alpha [Microbispora sp. ATCC PTA-5024]|uniref:integrin alpha n=1 Tax=Microbispora sp. ATCC PTA-5024 TaxID=316330 RepID=UPI0003DBA837|nr:integrin alpha [Microbispora sp. ATCC PTA-5024]ETK30941.1 hypothetical protein MPTA5024_37400 [Microbispora sp. ATCC PTA-5024]
MRPPSVLAAVAALILLAALPPAAASPALARTDGCAGAGAADFDGDGTDDAVAGDPFAGVGGLAGAGAVHVLLDAGRGGVLALHAPVPSAGAAFGWSVRTAHVDADRCLDVVVGAPYADQDGTRDAGAAYVVFGTPSGTPRVAVLRPDPERDAHFGWSVAAAELGEGGALVAVGVPHADSDGERDSGAIDLFRVRETPERLARITQDSDGVIGNSEAGDMYGWAVALGHLGGRPDDLDLAVGVPYENDDGAGRQVDTGRIDAGMVGVVFDVATARGHYGSVKWDLRQATDAVRESSGDRFGYALDYAEWKGDGYLAATAPLTDGGTKDSGLVQVFVRRGAGRLAPLRALGPVSAWSLAWWDAGGVLSLAAGAPYAPSGPAREAGVVRAFADAGQSAGNRQIVEGSGRQLAAGSAAYEHLGAAVTDVGGATPFTPGRTLLAGAPDHGPTGAVALLDGGRATYRPPGTGVSSADLGAAVAG